MDPVKQEKLSANEYERVRGMMNRLGAPKAAEALNISKPSLLALVAGSEVKNGTIVAVKKALAAGAFDTVVKEKG